MLKAESTKQVSEREFGKGPILIGLGTLFLAGQIVDFSFIGQATPLLLGLIFIAAGIISRKSGLMIPGGILSGIGLGTLVAANGLGAKVSWLNSSDADGALFLFFFALGWASIPFLSGLFTSHTHWWAFIPATIFLVISATVAFGGIFETILTVGGKLWPLLLIGAGISILLKQRNNVPKTIDFK